MRKSVKTALALLATMATIPVVFASASSATDLGGLQLITNGNDLSRHPSMSNDGNLIVFETNATDLPGGPTAAGKNIVLYDVDLDTFTKITNNTGTNEFPTISGDGRYVSYDALSGGEFQVIVYNVATKDTTIMTNGTDGASLYAEVANDGTVVYQSAATDLNAVADPNGAVVDVFMTTLNGTVPGPTVKVSDGAGSSTAPSIADDGSLVAYQQTVAGVEEIFTYSVASSTATQRTTSDFDSTAPAVDADGSHIAFGSYAMNLPNATAYGHQNVFVFDLAGSTFSRLTDANASINLTDISADGEYVAFTSFATNLSTGTDVNGFQDLFRVKSDGVVNRLSNDVNGFSSDVAISEDGLRAAFFTEADNQVPGMNGNGNIVMWERYPTTPVTTTTTTTTVAPTTTTTAPPAPTPVCTSTTPPASAGYGLTTTPSDRNTLYRAYCVTLFRYPDMGGFEYWLGVRQAGVSWQFIEDTMADSPEFKQRYGTLNDVDFVKRLYVDVLERGSDKDGLAYWTELLTSKKLNRGEILFQFSDSQEFKNQTGTA